MFGKTKINEKEAGVSPFKKIGCSVAPSYHPPAPGSSPKHTIYAFITYNLICAIFVTQKECNEQRTPDWIHFKKEINKNRPLPGFEPLCFEVSRYRSFHVRRIFVKISRCGIECIPTYLPSYLSTYLDYKSLWRGNDKP